MIYIWPWNIYLFQALSGTANARPIEATMSAGGKQ